MGSDEEGQPFAPQNGDYQNAIVTYEINKHVYIYASDGIYTRINQTEDAAPSQESLVRAFDTAHPELATKRLKSYKVEDYSKWSDFFEFIAETMETENGIWYPYSNNEMAWIYEYDLLSTDGRVKFLRTQQDNMYVYYMLTPTTEVTTGSYTRHELATVDYADTKVAIHQGEEGTGKIMQIDPYGDLVQSDVLETKLDVVKKPTAEVQVYAKREDGAQQMLNLSEILPEPEGLFLGYLTKGDQLPSTRPNGDPLEQEDYFKIDPETPEGDFPFVLSNATDSITINSPRDRGIYTGTKWVVEIGAFQDTSETPVKTPATESISKTGLSQQAINQENVVAIENRVSKQLGYNLTRDAWLAQIGDESIIDGTGTFTDVAPEGETLDQFFITAVKRNDNLYWLLALGNNGMWRCTKNNGTWSNWEIVGGGNINYVETLPAIGKEDSLYIVGGYTEFDPGNILDKPASSFGDHYYKMTNMIVAAGGTYDQTTQTLSYTYNGVQCIVPIAIMDNQEYGIVEPTVETDPDAFCKWDQAKNRMVPLAGDEITDLYFKLNTSIYTIIDKDYEGGALTCEYDDGTSITRESISWKTLCSGEDVFPLSFLGQIHPCVKSEADFYILADKYSTNSGVDPVLESAVCATICGIEPYRGKYIYENSAYIDISTKNMLKQCYTMPEPIAAKLGKVVEYIGPTNNNFTHGYFYECASTVNPGEYEWRNISVQDGNIKTTIIRRDVDTYASTVEKLFTTKGAIFVEDGGLYYKCGDFEEDTTNHRVLMEIPRGTTTSVYAVYQSDNSWSKGTLFNEMQNYRVENINSSSDDNHYPTAKAVYTQVKNKIDQYGTGEMPTPKAALSGKVVEYIGTTTTDYTHGYFYECAIVSGSYAWKNIQVQDGNIKTTIVKYNVDTYAEVLAKLQPVTEGMMFVEDEYGLQVIGRWNRNPAINRIDMYVANGDRVFDYYIEQDEGIWHRTMMPMELTKNKTTTITPTATNDEYPSAKAVFKYAVGQYYTMPSPTENLEDKIVQYVGNTSVDYTNGFFYECVVDPTTTPISYKWVRKTVQNDSYDNTTIGRNASDEYYVKDNGITKAKLDTNLISDSIPTSGSGSPDKLTTENAVVNYTQAIFDLIYPVGSYYFGANSPTLGTWVEVQGDKAIWIKNGTADGTNITQALPKPTVSSTFTGSSATTNSTGSHTHTFTGTSGTTSSNGAHTHSRGTMEITGTLGSICNQGGTSSGAFTYKRDSNAELSGDNQSRGTWTFTASKNWTGETSSNGSHTHTLTPAGSNANSGSHSHTVTAKGSVTSSVNTAGVYGDGTKVQPDAVVMTVWKRTA